MSLKLYLNKFLKVDNIEGYCLDTLNKIKDAYEKFLETSEGVDPDYPSIVFNEGKQKKIKGKNKFQVMGKTSGEDGEEGEEVDITNDFFNF